MDKLLINLIHLIIESTNATRVALLLPDGDGWVVVADGAMNQAINLFPKPLEQAEALPLSLIKYVIYTKEPVLLDNASHEGAFTHDFYIQATRAKSILCQPLLNQGKLSGVLYVENNLATAVFTVSRLQIFNLLSTQAAISLENAQLCNTLAQKLAAQTEQLHKINVALQISQERYQALFEDAPIAIWEEDFSAVKQYLDILHARGIYDMFTYFAQQPQELAYCWSLAKVVDVNQAAVELYQAKDKAELMRDLTVTLAPETIPVMEAAMLSILQGRPMFECETVNRKLNGEIFNIILRSFVPPSSTNSYAQVLIFIIDITHLRQTEAALILAKEQAKVAYQAKSTFLATMSHELRTPLNAILGFAQIMVGSRALPPEQRENVGIISRSGEHLLILINNVLEISKIEAGHITLSQNSFDLYRLLDEVHDMFQFKADDKELYLIFEYEPQLPQFIQTDQVKLRQVLIHLLNNALKFTQAGGVTLTVRHKEGEIISQLPTPYALLHFTLVDTGVGIASHEMEKLFEAFVQTESGQQAHEGMGLGLSISRHFVKMMGGDIRVDSQVGQGTTFSFDIMAQVVSASAIQRVKPLRRIIALEVDQPRYRILVVDDVWTNRQLLVRLLKPLGFELQEAENGAEAVARWQEWRPDLIWMDIGMPVMDGYEATKRIKAQVSSGQLETPTFPVIIALTASILEEERATVLAAGCDDFMRKPFKDTDIFEMTARHLGVRYVYEELTEVMPAWLTPELLAILPLTLRQRLAKAIDLADVETAQAVIGEIAPHHPAIISGLRELVNNFAYDTLLNLINDSFAKR